FAYHVSSFVRPTRPQTTPIVLTSRPPIPRTVRRGEPAIADDIGDQDRGEFAGHAHPSGAPALRMPYMARSRCFKKTGLSLCAPARKRRMVNLGSSASAA